MESAEKRAQAATNILRLMVNCKCPKCKPSSRSEHSFQVSSRVTCNPNFISQDFLHFSSFIHNGDNMNMYVKLIFHGEILKNTKLCAKKIVTKIV